MPKPINKKGNLDVDSPKTCGVGFSSCSFFEFFASLLKGSISVAEGVISLVGVGVGFFVDVGLGV